jgi:hypothetical protein
MTRRRGSGLKTGCLSRQYVHIRSTNLCHNGPRDEEDCSRLRESVEVLNSAYIDRESTHSLNGSLELCMGRKGSNFFLVTGGDMQNHTPLRSRITRLPNGLELL